VQQRRQDLEFVAVGLGQAGGSGGNDEHADPWCWTSG
jgi:hypothetical protein